MKEKLILIGSGGHALSCADVIELEGRFEIDGVVLENEEAKNALSYPILGTDADLKSLLKDYKFAFLALGQIKSPLRRMELFERLKILGFILPSIISPLAYVSKNATLDEGSIVMHHALINAGAKVGKACIINSKALIEHTAVVEDFCHISTAAVVNGECVVKKGSFLGSNTHLRHQQILKENSIYYHKLSSSALHGGGVDFFEEPWRE